MVRLENQYSAYFWASEYWCSILLDELGMNFKLLYRGPLKPNANPLHKHLLRQQFHLQLSVLWNSVPFLAEIGRVQSSYQNPSTGTKEYRTRIEKLATEHTVKSFRFVPLISKELGLACSLDILFLRREEPGELAKTIGDSYGGDVDNRFKTLLDALKVPSTGELPPGVGPQKNEDPFFCLLEDDSLLTEYCVKSDRLLFPYNYPMTSKVVTDAAGYLYQRILEGLQIPDRATWDKELRQWVEVECERQKVEHEAYIVIDVKPLIADPSNPLSFDFRY